LTFASFGNITRETKKGGYQMFDLVFISGATGGLGKAFAVECASRGWDVFLTDLDVGRLEMLAASLRSTYDVRVIYHACDLTDFEARTELFTFIRIEGFVFHMLINVAGIDYVGWFGERSRDEIRTIIRLNIESTLDVTHTLLNHAAAERPFRIINVASLAAFYPMPSMATYAASKRFLLNFSLALGDELRERNATVTALCPAGMPTNADCREAIEAQGIPGQLTTINIGFVATKTIDHALRGSAIYIPGALNRFLQLAGGLVPPVILAKLIGARWRATYKKRMATVQHTATASV
jgi:short-subunit dehydrogenase